MDRVVITGMGTVNPLGLTVAETWQKVTAGVSGVGPITLFDSSGLGVHFAAEVKHFDPATYMDAKEARRRDRVQQMGVAAAKEALAESGLQITDETAGRIATVVGSGGGGIRTFQDAVVLVHQEGARRISPFMIPMFMPNGTAGVIAMDYGLLGPCFSLASACATGLDAIGVAWLMLKAGMVDAAVAGAAEGCVSEIVLAAFDRVGALSRRNDDYSMAPQPFDKNRDGLVVGEGAAVVVLEREDAARKRGASILAELAGYGAAADAYHVTAPHPAGRGSAAAMSAALNAARAAPDDVDYISAHGTGTSLNDAAETRAIKTALGDKARRVAISSTKSMTAHMMGSTGALETIFCVLAIRDGILPPTIHYETPDPDCDLDYVPNAAREQRVDLALNNAFGFGGHNSVIAVRRYA